MASVLVVSSSAQGTALLSGLLKTAGYDRQTDAAAGSHARRGLIDTEYDLVLINAPLRDEFGDELALLAARKSAAGVIMVVKNDLADDISAKVEEDGVLVVQKPINRAAFFQTVKLAGAAHRRVASLRSENMKLQSKIEEIRLVDRAKCALIQYRGLTEPEAHRFIEKEAMDLRAARREVALDILKTFADRSGSPQ